MSAKFENVSIIGDGAMATICASLLGSNNIKVKMWGYDSVQLSEMADAGENKKFLPGFKIDVDIEYEPDDSKIFQNSELVVNAVPCQFIRPVFTRLKKYFPANLPIVSVTKGIENNTLLRPCQVLKDILGDKIETAVLSGPTIADEIAHKLPASACVASDNQILAQKIQHSFNTAWFRVYTNSDVVGVELAGAMKNVIAIAAGIIDGVKAGDNAKAALLARGLAEIKRLGVAVGASEETFFGLSGIGDLVTTCISPMGRNRSFGERIGKGMNVESAIGSTKSVIEGVATCKSVIDLAQKYKVQMPITEEIYAIVFENKSVKEAIASLMSRKLKSEKSDF